MFGPINATIDINATPTAVPANARAIYAAVQGNPQSGAMQMTLFPGSSSLTDPGIANWSTTTVGQLGITYMLVPLIGGKFMLHSFFTGQIFVDVWGYLL